MHMQHAISFFVAIRKREKIPSVMQFTLRLQFLTRYSFIEEASRDLLVTRES
jgi:hypothetical protein